MTDPIPEKPEHDVLPPEPGGALSVPPPVPQKQPGFLRRLFMSRRKQQALAMQNGYLEMVDLIRAIRSHLDRQETVQTTVLNMLAKVPDAMDRQHEVMTMFKQQLESGMENNRRLTDSMGNLNNTLASIDESQRASSRTITDLIGRSRESEQLLREVMRRSERRMTGLLVLSIAVATIFFWRPSATLAVSLRSYWLLIHVVVAMLGTAFFALGAGVAVMQLLQSRRERAVVRSRAAQASEVAADLGEAAYQATAAGGVNTATEVRPVTEQSEPSRGGGRMARLLASLPGTDRLEQLTYRVNIIGFVFWTFTLIFGALWAQKAWGRYWGWDVKEVWTFIIWTIYAGYLHAHATRGWRGDRAAWLAIVGFLSVIFNFTIVNIFFQGWHAYSGL